MKTDELREKYLAFFETKGCTRRQQAGQGGATRGESADGARIRKTNRAADATLILLRKIDGTETTTEARRTRRFYKKNNRDPVSCVDCQASP
jgi:hypothetical protein